MDAHTKHALNIYEKNPHKYEEVGDGIFSEHRCGICHMNVIYHQTIRQWRWDSVKYWSGMTVLVVFAMAVFVGCGVTVKTFLPKDSTPYEKCVAAGGDWSYSETGPDYCTVEAR